MYSIATFGISLAASDADKLSITAFLTEKLKGQENVFDVGEWPASLGHVENLAIALARFTPHISFQMDGHISDDYGYEDFSIKYANGFMTLRTPGEGEYDVYSSFEDYYPSYEDFCDFFWDDDNNRPRYTKEEYEEFCSWDEVFITDSRRILEHEPLLDAVKTYRITPDAVIPESSDDDWDDDEDFEEED